MDNDSQGGYDAGAASDSQASENDSQGQESSSSGGDGGWGPGGWESQVAEKGYSTQAGQTQADADPGAMAAMGEVHGRSTSDISTDLAMEFGFKGLRAAYDRYGLVEAIGAFARSQISTAVSSALGFLAQQVNVQLALTVATKVNPTMALPVAIAVYAFSTYRTSQTIKGVSAEIDAAVRGRGSASVADMMSEIGDDIGGEGGGAMFREFAKHPDLAGMTVTELVKLIQSTEEEDVHAPLYRRRSNIIGTGRMGLTID